MLPHVSWKVRLARTARAVGPYGLIELVVPGGSLIVLSMWAFKNRSWLADRVGRAFVRDSSQSRANSRRIGKARD